MQSLPDSELNGLRETYVKPFYLRLLGGQFVHSPKPDDERDFLLPFGKAVRSIDDHAIERLLAEYEWRGRLCAAWFVGIKRKEQFIGAIGDRLLASEMTYAGQGYCLALAVIGGEQPRDLLIAYLQKYLPLNGRVYDQHWAIDALAYLLGSPPGEFSEPSLWQFGSYVMNWHSRIGTIGGIIKYLKQHGLIENS